MDGWKYKWIDEYNIMKFKINTCYVNHIIDQSYDDHAFSTNAMMLYLSIHSSIHPSIYSSHT